jgi:hypothetical protein
MIRIAAIHSMTSGQSGCQSMSAMNIGALRVVSSGGKRDALPAARLKENTNLARGRQAAGAPFVNVSRNGLQLPGGSHSP